MSMLYFFLGKAFRLAGSTPLPIVLGKMRRFLFLFVGVGFLSVALTACSGGSNGGSSGSGGGNNPATNGTLATDEEGNMSVRGTGNLSMDNISNTDEGGSVSTDSEDNSTDEEGDNVSMGDEAGGTSVMDGETNQSTNTTEEDNPMDKKGDNVSMGDGVGGEGDPSGMGGDTMPDVNEPDGDKDGVADELDVDRDGDGLIEITTADGLNGVRYALDGSGRRLAEGDPLNTAGCGNGNTTTSCVGYELAANISLASYADADGGKGWQPLGHDTNNATDGCQGSAFDGIFEGNGFVISDLRIQRLRTDCVGLFGHITESSEIHNLTLHADRVAGEDSVGALVGDGSSAVIVSSSAEVRRVSGSSKVGGLVGDGTGVQIVNSSIVVGEVSATNTNSYVGGLVGDGMNARIFYSFVKVGEVSGEIMWVGGLIGYGEAAEVVSSSVIANEVDGIRNVGGLIGYGEAAQVVSSSVVVGRVGSTDRRSDQAIGGLVGYGFDSQIYSSSVVARKVIGSDDQVGGLTGYGQRARGIYSYVISNSNITLFGAENGEGAYNNASYINNLSSMPTDYTGIYASWNKTAEPLAVWCDRDNSESIESDERTNDNRIWDFGTENEYPAIRCTPIAPADWRDWWFLNRTTGDLQLDQARLNELLP